MTVAGKEVRKVTLCSWHSTRKTQDGLLSCAVMTFGKPALLLGLHTTPRAVEMLIPREGLRFVGGAGFILMIKNLIRFTSLPMGEELALP